MSAIRKFLIIALVFYASTAAFAEESKRTIDLEELKGALAAPAMPAINSTERMATIASLKGFAETKSAKSGWEPALEGMVLKQGDMVRTKQGAHMVLVMDGAEETAIIQVMENSQITISLLQKNVEEDYYSTLLDVTIGKILVKAKKIHSQKAKFEVQTPSSLIGVRGTTFSVSVRELESSRD